MMAPVDPETFRAESRDRWERAAPGWAATREALQRAAAEVSAWLVDAVEPQPGQTVLELAAGAGDTGLLAAERVGPEGRVIITDGAEAMVDVARARAQELGLGNVELRPMEAEWIDLPAASVDGVLCRWGYMLLVDPETALRETRRVLRPGSSVALAAWDAPEQNPWLAVAGREAVRAGLWEPPMPGDPGPFALGDPARIEELLQAAGFDEVEVGALDLTFEAESLDAWWDHTLRTSTWLSDPLERLSPAEHYAFREAFDAAYAPWVDDRGAVRLPARTLVASATA
jgi:SAM-dependent methyltransferase